NVEKNYPVDERSTMRFIEACSAANTADPLLRKAGYPDSRKYDDAPFRVPVSQALRITGITPLRRVVFLD
ncbi:hypothetical protein, partial [Pseudomonas sp. JAI120]|uniref:hypothetical protein n=1 Tax=Pseudomonas sp. JAI120 TaxID=2723063 RepID=UPI0030EB494D